MTRTGDTTSSADDKLKMIKELKPDFCVAVHHDSSTNTNANGFGAFYFNAFSKRAAEYVFSQTEGASLYGKYNFNWHYYFMCRSTVCPVVLTENGYISNKGDFSGIENEQKNIEKARAVAHGIVDYFRSIQ